jgi:hypothetical protein
MSEVIESIMYPIGGILLFFVVLYFIGKATNSDGLSQFSGVALGLVSTIGLLILVIVSNFGLILGIVVIAAAALISVLLFGSGNKNV